MRGQRSAQDTPEQSVGPVAASGAPGLGGDIGHDLLPQGCGLGKPGRRSLTNVLRHGVERAQEHRQLLGVARALAAVRRKLVLEIAGRTPEDALARN